MTAKKTTPKAGPDAATVPWSAPEEALHRLAPPTSWASFAKPIVPLEERATQAPWLQLFQELHHAQKLLEAALYDDPKKVREFLQDKVEPESPRDFGALHRVSAMRCLGIDALSEVKERNALQAVYPSGVKYELLRIRVALLALALGQIEKAQTLWKALKPPARFVPRQTFPWDFARTISYLISAAKNNAREEDARPAWDTFVDALPLWQAGWYIEESPVELLHLVGRFYYVQIAKRPVREVLEALFLDLQPRRQRTCKEITLAQPQGRWEEIQAAQQGTLLTRLTTNDLCTWERDRRYNVMTQEQRLGDRVEASLLAGMLFGPEVMRPHLTLAAMHLEEELSPLRKLDLDRPKYTAAPFTFLALVRASGASCPPESNFPSDQWIDAVREYQGPIPSACIQTAALAALALRGEEELQAFEKKSFWTGFRLAERTDLGWRIILRLRAALLAKDAVVCEEALSQYLAQGPLDRDLLWVAWAALVQGMKRPPNEVLGALHEMITKR